MTQQLKPPTTYEQQIEKLCARGCQVTDISICAKILSRINYYRLSAYFLPFKDANGKYAQDTDFNNVYQIYEFDRNLRNILFAAIEEVEIYLRANFAYHHAHKYGALGYMDAANYNKKHRHDTFLKLLDVEKKNNRKVLFVQHHAVNYGGQFPVWVITELFTFGMLSYFYGDLPMSDQKHIARELFRTVPKNLISWLRCCTDLRNICAHYGRLYFRIFTAVPANLHGLAKNTERRLFGVILALKALYPDPYKWNSEIHPVLCSLVEKYSPVINLVHIGFPVDWASMLKAEMLPPKEVSPKSIGLNGTSIQGAP
jgi:abortive infection bacteriophage resistance protein